MNTRGAGATASDASGVVRLTFAIVHSVMLVAIFAAVAALVPPRHRRPEVLAERTF